MISLKDKNALITGSSRGVGQQIVLGLAKLGCNLIIHGRTKESCAKTLELLKDSKVNIYCVTGELTDENQVNNIISQVKDLKINVDILYNNAAIMSPWRDDFYTHNWDDWATSMKANVFALYTLCSAFMPDMVKRNFGRIINTTSGIADQPELAPYGASKWAVDKITDDLAFKTKGTNVKVNTLDPGWCKTDLGGQHADHPVEAVLPGALAPALIDENGDNGIMFSAIDHKINKEELEKLFI